MEIKTDTIYTSIKELPFSAKTNVTVRDAVPDELKRDDETLKIGISNSNGSNIAAEK